MVVDGGQVGQAIMDMCCLSHLDNLPWEGPRNLMRRRLSPQRTCYCKVFVAMAGQGLEIFGVAAMASKIEATGARS
jgi:hypothetical protein